MHESVDEINVAECLGGVLEAVGPVVVACSGGVDSLLLATASHRYARHEPIIVHAISPAVPAAATRRVQDMARAGNWRLEVIQSGEFEDPVYRANPSNRCYYCKRHLYSALQRIVERESQQAERAHYTVVSGANMDDLGEYRPGLIAAGELGVRHPFIEAGMGKQDIRRLSREYGLASADLPASPCLASRLYTGTTVTASLLAAVDRGEEFLKEQTGIRIVRCRVRQDAMHIEVSDADRHRIVPALIASLREELRRISPDIHEVALDPQPYRPGRAFVVN